MSAVTADADPQSVPLIEVRHLTLHFPVRSGGLGRKAGVVRAVDDVSLTVRQGETLGLVGESGCGKTTLARCLVRLLRPTGGELLYRGEDLTAARRRQLVAFRTEVQMVFQDPQASLNPRKRVGQIVGAGLRLADRATGRGGDRTARVREVLATVGLDPDHVNRFPHEFSGGQRQRIGVARALAVSPRLIVLDEPVSALDVSIQAQVVNLLDDLQDDLGLAYVFVAHDLSVVRHVSDRIAVMYLGKIVEVSPAEDLYTKPIHPYTESLLASVPLPVPGRQRTERRRLVAGELPSPNNPPSGCRFHTRCPHVTDICSAVEPPLTVYPGGHAAACHHPRHVTPEDLAAATRSPDSPADAGPDLPTAVGDPEPTVPAHQPPATEAEIWGRPGDGS